MPELHLMLDADIKEKLEAVRTQQGLETLDQAAEYLLRKRLRKGASGITGRGRALYLVTRDGGLK